MDLKLDKRIYSDACISKAVYSLSGKYSINRTVNGDSEILHIKSLEEGVPDAAVEHECLSALNDYKLRQIIEEETHDIRTILYAKAFADCDDL